MSAVLGTGAAGTGGPSAEIMLALFICGVII